MKPPVPGLVRTLEEAASNQHPLPIIMTSDYYFRLMCAYCDHVGELRSVLQTAIADRIKHERSHA